jgi:hypothetical protein
MSWELGLAIVAGWMVIPPLAWTLAHEILRFLLRVGIIRPAQQSNSGADVESWLSRFRLRHFRQVQR